MEAQELDIGPLPKEGAVAMDTFQGRSRQKGDNSIRGRASGGPPWRVMGKPSQRAPTSFPRRCSQYPVRQDSTCHHRRDHLCRRETPSWQQDTTECHGGGSDEFRFCPNRPHFLFLTSRRRPNVLLLSDFS